MLPFPHDHFFRHAMTDPRVAREFVTQIHVVLPSLIGEDIMTFAEICKNEGIELGMQKGIVVGRVEGESAVLIELLECRFGEVPEYYRDLIQQADSDRLLTWCKKVLTAQTLAEVFSHH